MVFGVAAWVLQICSGGCYVVVNVFRVIASPVDGVQGGC